MFAGSLEEENSMLGSFLNDSWRDEYELRVDNELISEENWSEILRERDGKDVVIHVLTKPPLEIVRWDASRATVTAYRAHSIQDGLDYHRRYDDYLTRACEFITGMFCRR